MNRITRTIDHERNPTAQETRDHETAIARSVAIARQQTAERAEREQSLRSQRERERADAQAVERAERRKRVEDRLLFAFLEAGGTRDEWATEGPGIITRSLTDDALTGVRQRQERSRAQTRAEF